MKKIQEANATKKVQYNCNRNYIPLVKICGITNERDAGLAVELGADILGFVFAPSPRRAEPSLVEKLSDLAVIKVAVVVCSESNPSLQSDLLNLIDRNLIDAVQFHGSERPSNCYRAAFPYFKAIRVKSISDLDRVAEYRCPRVLLDAFSPDAPGGTGTCIPAEILKTAAKRFPLWLAGGIGPENVRGVIRDFKPELIDASSKLEASPGIKDPAKLKTFFKEIQLGCSL